jgi:hypothetical protein
LSEITLNWPSKLHLGAVTTLLKPIAHEDLVSLFAEEFPEEIVTKYVPLAVYDSGDMTILFREDVRNSNPYALKRRDLDICHEIIHMWEDLILANQYNFSEAETQGLALALHNLIYDILNENVKGVM